MSYGQKGKGSPAKSGKKSMKVRTVRDGKGETSLLKGSVKAAGGK